MPTSTVWRRGASFTGARSTSPARPTHHDIEPLSPGPPTTFDFAAPPPYSSQLYASDTSLNGLGLGLSHTENGTRSEVYPQELGIDSRGVARLHQRAYAGTGQDDRYRSPARTWERQRSLQTRDFHGSKVKHHTRSGSTIDDLASAAIANSPTFITGSPRPFDSNGSPIHARPSTSHISPSHFRDNSEPPAKRIKSERLPATEWAAARPVTSYEPSQLANGHTQEALDLLLGIKTEVNFKRNITPRLDHAQLHRNNDSEQSIHSPFAGRPTSGHHPNNHSPDAMILDHAEFVVDDQPSLRGFASSTTAHGASDAIEENGNLDKFESQSTPTPEGSAEVLNVKKVRRLKPEQIQAEVCAKCGKQEQRISDDEGSISWIQCNGCNRWFHSLCAGIMGKAEARAVDKFICKPCEPDHGETTYVRTSSRARTAIDYAGLNQGVIKSSVETSLHHYIQPFKTNKLKIQPDDFARIRPELLTVDFFNNFDNMKRPFVVPAEWNPRFGMERHTEADRPEHTEGDICFDSQGKETEQDIAAENPTSSENVIDCEQDLLDMVMPRDLTVTKVADLVGREVTLPGVIDVKSQQTKGVWTLGKWADYYEETTEKPVRNVISLEVSETALGRVLRRPKVVRDLDLEDHVWSSDDFPDKKKKSVKFYCLMSVADSYTDFHIDFGGSSVYYHILKGTKTFFFIPPEDKYLKKYEDWCNSSSQDTTWLGDLCNGNVTRVDLHEGDTAFIPAGWIHSVWTPEDSLVIGGNFLTHTDYELQFKVANVEKNTNVGLSFRYPFFQKVMWHTLLTYLAEDPLPEDVLADFEDDEEFTFLRANPVWHEVDELITNGEPGSAGFNYRFYPKSEMKGLPALRDYLYRTARIAADLPVNNVTKKGIDSVKRSVPREYGDPMTLIKHFAIWCAWKTGGVKVPAWVHSDEIDSSEYERTLKKPKPTNHRIPGERSSSRRIAQQQVQEAQEQLAQPELSEIHQNAQLDQELVSSSVVMPYKPEEAADTIRKPRIPSTKTITARQACDACRKRRIRCRHKEGSLSNGKSPLSRSVSPLNPIGEFIPPSNGNANGIETMPQQTGDPSTYSLAQAALASLEAPAVDLSYNSISGQSPPSGKKSRSKACDECRKSKVCISCVHLYSSC